jgi:hypothetical protein
MGSAILAFVAALSASVVWLIVRVVNRHERWAKWALAMTIGFPSLYMLSFGPAFWMSDRHLIPSVDARYVYRPVGVAMVEFPGTVGRALQWYGTIGSPADFRSSVYLLMIDELERRQSLVVMKSRARTPDAPPKAN